MDAGEYEYQQPLIIPLSCLYRPMEPAVKNRAGNLYNPKHQCDRPDLTVTVNKAVP